MRLGERLLHVEEILAHFLGLGLAAGPELVRYAGGQPTLRRGLAAGPGSCGADEISLRDHLTFQPA